MPGGRSFDLLRRRQAPAESSAGLDLAAGIRDGQHRLVRMPAVLEDIPGMISGEERQLLMHVSEHAWRPGTQIIDGGCVLGASTRSLLEGLVRSASAVEIGGADPDTPNAPARPPIDSFDLFRADADMCNEYLPDSGLEVGDSFRSYYEQNLGPARHLVEVHEGDLRAAHWKPAPISVLFLDVITSWDINQWVMEHFYPRLVPERSFVIHEDFVSAWSPWTAITMEHFADHFEFVTDVPPATAVFRSVTPVSAEQAAVNLLSTLSPDTMLDLMDRAVDRFDGWPRGVLECSRANLMRYFGLNEEALGELTRIERDYAADEVPPRFAREIRGHIESGVPPRTI